MMSINSLFPPQNSSLILLFQTHLPQITGQYCLTLLKMPIVNPQILSFIKRSNRIVICDSGGTAVAQDHIRNSETYYRKELVRKFF